jgi:hypothetical protein
MIFIRCDGESDVYLNRRAGHEVRVARGALLGRERLLNPSVIVSGKLAWMYQARQWPRSPALCGAARIKLGE